MSSPPTMRRRHHRPASLGDHAAQDLKFIRQTMERASSLTAIPGWGQVVIGVTALVAAVIAARTVTLNGWLTVWLSEAALAFAIGSASMAFKARSLGASHPLGHWKQFALSFSLPVLAGGLLTIVLARSQAAPVLAGTWMLLYGVAIAVGGAFSVASVRAMGYAFMALGAITLLVPGIHADAALAAGFGGLHVVFGVWIARRHGG